MRYKNNGNLTIFAYLSYLRILCKWKVIKLLCIHAKSKAILLADKCECKEIFTVKYVYNTFKIGKSTCLLKFTCVKRDP